MSKIKTILLTGVLVFSMAFMSACAGKTGDQQEAAVEETAPAAEEVTEEPEESEAAAEVQEDTAETTQAALPDGTGCPMSALRRSGTRRPARPPCWR